MITLMVFVILYRRGCLVDSGEDATSFTVSVDSVKSNFSVDAILLVF